MGKQWKQWETFLGSKITADGSCSHEMKRRLLLGGKAMTNLDSVLKSRDITLPTKVRLVKVMVFPVVMYGCESWTIKKTEHLRIDAFELWWWRRLLRVPCIAKRSISIKRNQPWIFTGRIDEALILWPPDSKSWLIGKDPDAVKNWRQGEKGMTEFEMVGWHHWLNGYKFEQISENGEGRETWHVVVNVVARNSTWLSNWRTNQVNMNSNSLHGSLTWHICQS